MSKTKLALLGVGDVAQRDYLPEFHRLADRAEIVAACGRTASRPINIRFRIVTPITPKC